MENNEEKPKVDVKTVEILHELVKRRFATSLDTIDKLDQKLITLISVDAIVISILFTNTPFYNKACFYIAAGFIILSLVLGICGYTPKNVYGEDPKATWKDYYNYKYEEAINQITSNLVEAYNRNSPIIEEKAKFITYGFYALFAGIVILFVAKLM